MKSQIHQNLTIVTITVSVLMSLFTGTYLFAASSSEVPVKAVHKEIFVDAVPESVWAAWTTPEGVRSFFAPECNVKLEANAPYEILFFPDAEPGSRGAEDCTVLAYQPNRMFAFTWSAPPQYPDIRKQRTAVVMRFYPAPGGKTRVTLTQTGWGEGGNWDRTYEYFTEAWDRVLFRLKVRFEKGAVDWSDPPHPPGQ